MFLCMLVCYKTRSELSVSKLIHRPPPLVLFCLYIPAKCVYMCGCTCRHPQIDKPSDEHKLVPGSFHPFACCCVWLLWCSCGLPGETGRWRSWFDVGLGLFDQGRNYASSKEAAAACWHLRCGSMCWYMRQPYKQLMPKTDKNTSNVNIAYSTLDGADNRLAHSTCTCLRECVSVGFNYLDNMSMCGCSLKSPN